MNTETVLDISIYIEGKCGSFLNINHDDEIFFLIPMKINHQVHQQWGGGMGVRIVVSRGLLSVERINLH